ncbi:MAG: hypothetical protein AB8A39_06705, partial [Prochlorococcus sp.]
ADCLARPGTASPGTAGGGDNREAVAMAWAAWAGGGDCSGAVWRISAPAKSSLADTLVSAALGSTIHWRACIAPIQISQLLQINNELRCDLPEVALLLELDPDAICGQRNAVAGIFGDALCWT